MTHIVPPANPPTLTNMAYKVLKQITTIWLPGLATLYLALDGIWDVPAEEKVVATIAAINVFLGLFLAQASKNYDRSDVKFDGDIATDGDNLFNMQLNQPVAPSTENGELRLKVQPEAPPAA